MKRLKVLGVAMLAVFAISAIAASAAQAAEFHSTIEKTFLFGEQEGEPVFAITAGKVKCKEASFDSLIGQVGTGGGNDWKTATFTVQPKYGKCTAFGQTMIFENGPAGTQPCDYHFNTAAPNQVTVTGTPVPAWGSPADVGCTLTINVPSGNCMLTVNQQKPGTPTVAFATTTFEGFSAVKETSSIKGITYTVDGPIGSICGEPGTYTNGEYSGNVILRGYKSGTHTKAEQVGISYK
jgi:hypothetical protein